MAAKLLKFGLKITATIHDLWINPANSKNMINANDGGGTVSFDGGQSWSSIMNQPTAQFYRVITDNQVPYRMYGGQQDNTTMSLPSETFGPGISYENFMNVGGGESAHIAFDPDNPRYIYATTINSTLTEFDAKTGKTRLIQPYAEYVFGVAPKDIYYRTNWNAPVVVNPHDTSIIYYGAHKLIRTDDRGVTWTEISPDLTRNEKEKQGLNGGPITNESVGAEYYNTIFYIQPSLHEKDTIWVGSDDGLVHLTRDEGKNWQNVTPKGAPEALINAIDVSPHDAGTAYLAVTAYKTNDFRPYIYKTTNYGKNWKRLDKGLPNDAFVRVVREDPVRKGLLYAGTEAGMFVSFDDGKNWQSLRLNLPPVPITDLRIHRDDLVIATQGRGFYVMDDISLLQQLDGDESDQDLTVFTPSDAYLMRASGWAQTPTAPNPPAGVGIIYHLKDDIAGELTIDIHDGSGRLSGIFPARKATVTAVVWAICHRACSAKSAILQNQQGPMSGAGICGVLAPCALKISACLVGLVDQTPNQAGIPQSLRPGTENSLYLSTCWLIHGLKPHQQTMTYCIPILTRRWQ